MEESNYPSIEIESLLIKFPRLLLSRLEIPWNFLIFEIVRRDPHPRNDGFQNLSMVGKVGKMAEASTIEGAVTVNRH